MLRAARSPLVPLLALVALLVTAFALAACGGGGDGDDSPTEAETTASVPDSGCGEIEEVDVPMAGAHSDRDFTADDYSTNPPAGGDHNPNALQAATFYDDASEPAPLGQAVHLLEHGAIIGWTNGLSKPDLKAVEDEFNDIYADGYYQLATVENPDLDVPFALSAWGAVQRCATVDTAAIRPFVEQWYASPKSAESSAACQGGARELANC